jgi:uncharacterized protein YgbK (DUF1537 family)
MMKQLAIIADDLTSATDCGIQVAKSGLNTLVLLGEYKIIEEGHEADVISIDTDTRIMSGEEAYRIVKEVTTKILMDGYPVIYKSLDSTLRGHLGAEIDAILDVSEFDFAVISPAFPLYGRTTLNGKHFLNGVPITQTEFASDPQNPIIEGDLVKLFSSQSKREVGLIELNTLRGGVNDVSEQLREFKSRGIELVIFDAEVEEDLDRIVQTVSNTEYNVLWVGSTGMARCIRSVLSVLPRNIIRKYPSSFPNPILLVSGSASQVTREQLAVFESLPNVISVEMNPLNILSSDLKAKKEIDRCYSRLIQALNNGKDVALHVSSSRRDIEITKAKGREMGLEEKYIPVKILEALANITQQVIDTCEIQGLILTGGDTAKTICIRLGGTGIELLEEIEPGIPLGRLFGTTETFVITKAGAFGTSKTFVKALKILKGYN